MIVIQHSPQFDQRTRCLSVAVLGYGNQGQAHALNLRDSGASVSIGQRAGGRGFALAQADGFTPQPIENVIATSELLILALPDDTMADIYDRSILPQLHAGQALGFIHGFNLHFGLITPPPDMDVIMVAPKGPGKLVRSTFENGSGLTALMAIAQNATGMARDTALAWAAGIGATRAGVRETTFEQECISDLFGEQTVLCGGMVSLMNAAFETLVNAGYPDELAYFECVHEVKQIVDLIYDGGLELMRSRISSTARYGGLTRGPDMVPKDVRAAMRAALTDIESGEFARRFISDAKAGGPEMKRLLASEAASRMTLARQKVFGPRQDSP